jgi:uncharacterized protein YgbK (DUF1537 family)
MFASAGVQATVVPDDALSIRRALNDRSSGVIVCDGTTDTGLHDIAEVARERRDVILAGPGGIARCWSRSMQCEADEPPRLTQVSRWLLVCGSMHPVSRRQVRVAAELGLQCLVTPDARRERDDPMAGLVDDAVAVLGTGNVDGLILFGGETARAVLLGLGCCTLSPVLEVLPGVPVALVHAGSRDIPVVTKAGGFGDENLVKCILNRLTR